MRVLVIGAGNLGSRVIAQLKKNPRLNLLVADADSHPKAVKEGLIPRVDVLMHITPLNFKELIEKASPDIVLLARTTYDWGQDDTPMGEQYTTGMERELTKFGVPVLPVSGEVLGP